jgi:hypothetical protein
MRPTVPEQLDGIARILEEVVAPELGAPYPADVLAGAVATLRTLAAAHDALPAFLEWDTARTLALLAEAGVAAEPAPGEPLEVRHERARSALEAAVPRLSRDPDQRSALLALFAERAQRFPLAPGDPRARPAR